MGQDLPSQPLRVDVRKKRSRFNNFRSGPIGDVRNRKLIVFAVARQSWFSPLNAHEPTRSYYLPVIAEISFSAKFRSGKYSAIRIDAPHTKTKASLSHRKTRSGRSRKSRKRPKAIELPTT